MGTMCKETMDKVINDHFTYEATDDVEGVLLRLLHVFELRDGLITKENLWFDFDGLNAQLT